MNEVEQGMTVLSSGDSFSGPWCDDDCTTTAIMEAISFVTPLLETFCVTTVARVLCSEALGAELAERCRAFAREEAGHSRIHMRFNASLEAYLHRPPPGLQTVQRLLDGARRRLSLANRLLVVAAIEHCAAVLSKVYLQWVGARRFRIAFVKDLFTQHAREELAHRAVAFDLSVSIGRNGRARRALALSAVLLAGFLYLTGAAAWILHRKSRRGTGRTLAALAKFFVPERSFVARVRSCTGDLVAFARENYHPQWLVQEPVMEADT
jgi:predicted metal-dependent hydrolase